MASAHSFTKFDPTEHPGNIYDKFCDSFGYEYESLSRTLPAGTAEVDAWKELDKRKVLLGRCASRSLQLDFEDEVPVADRATISFADTVKKLKERYQPTRNLTLANYEFKKLRQKPVETFDTFVKRVKQEATFCDFSCTNPACTVKDIMIRDQIIIGTSDNDIRKAALKEQWSLTDLQSKGRQIEAAAFGAAQIKKESATSRDRSEDVEIKRTAL